MRAAITQGDGLLKVGDGLVGMALQLVDLRALLASGELEKHLVAPPGKAKDRLFHVIGFSLLGFGLILLILVINGFFVRGFV